MGTRILEGVRVNECDKPGAVFYDSTTGRAFGPVFDNAEEAERFLSFIAGVDPRAIGWGHASTGDELHKLWLASGRKDQREVFQFDKSFLSKQEPHEECLDCDDLIQMHRDGYRHCGDCDEPWDEEKGRCSAQVSGGWTMACSFVEHCFPLFSGLANGNNDVADILKKAGVIGDAEVDPEHSCLYVYFKSRKEAEQFLWRLNGWLRENWHRAYSTR